VIGLGGDDSSAPFVSSQYHGAFGDAGAGAWLHLQEVGTSTRFQSAISDYCPQDAMYSSLRQLY
jgi:hypothetical protein